MRTATKKAVPIKGLLSLHVCRGDLHTHAWFIIVESLAVYLLLWTANIIWCIRSIFPTERKVVSMHSRPVVILMSLTKVMSLLDWDVRDYAIAYGSGT